MQFLDVSKVGVLLAAVCLCLQGQNPPAKEAPKEAANEIKGLPPRANPAEYQVSAKAGDITIAAEFTGHSVNPAGDGGPLSTEDNVAVEVAFFGPAGARVTLSPNDFTLRINGKKSPLSPRPYLLVFSNLKDPQWEPPKVDKEKSKGGLTGGGENPQDNEPPPVVKVPFELQRAMSLRVQKAALPEGNRPVPVAGLIFFPYRGIEKHIRSVELVYEGPAGKATLALQ
jgi:hypothetical protein